MQATQTFTVDDREVQTMLERAFAALDDRRLAEGYLEDLVVPYLQTRTMAHFDKQGTDASPWKELSEMTQAYRFHQGFNPVWPINVRFGDFREWLTNDPGETEALGGSAQLTYPGPGPGGEEELKLETAMTGERAQAARPPLEISSTDAVSLLGFLQGYFEWSLRTGSRMALT